MDLLWALALKSGEVRHSAMAENASAPVSSLAQTRFSAAVSVRVAKRCHSAASGAANVSGPDTSKSAVFGVSKPIAMVNIQADETKQGQCTRKVGKPTWKGWRG